MTDNQYKNIPIMPVRGFVLYPYMLLTLDAMRSFSIKAVEYAMTADMKIFVTGQKSVSKERPGKNDLFETGTIASVKQIMRLPNNTVRVLVEGICPARLKGINSISPFITGEIELLEDKKRVRVSKNAFGMMRAATSLFEEYCTLTNHYAAQTLLTLGTCTEDVDKFSYLICSNLAIAVSKRQMLLEQRDGMKRLKLSIDILASEIEILRLESEVHDKARERIDKNQKEYYLREQIKILREELGDGDGLEDEIDSYYEKLKEAGFSEETEEKVRKEIKRLSTVPSSSHEAPVIRTWLDTVFDLPWNIRTPENTNIIKSEKILDKDHFGLEDVKKRILEYLVTGVKRKQKSTVICLVGPPGVGKTSVARSVARATGRNYQRLSLGGIRDEADIRGHRKTYIGAMPGRIIDAVRQAKSSNPLILLDEIDKMSSDFKGDPSAAMLEVLDREQNHSFRDHFLEIPFDLSGVMFITTANTTSSIPPALLDRMEVIELSGYTFYEKENIAMKHLIPGQLEEYGVEKGKISISKSAVSELISFYTMEAGVRNLEREIGSLVRKAICRINKEKLKSVKITDKNLSEYLGARKFVDESRAAIEEPGIANGLAYTSYGGSLLNIEVSVMGGSGKLELTGSLGDVIKESARTAYTYVRANSDKYKIPSDFYKKKDIHIHFPEGATPKDGPSAGITIVSAMVSALKEVRLRSDIAMTGEVTLRGRVLAIGGLKEKSLAAVRHGIKNIIIPFENKKDIENIPEELRKEINFIPVRNVSEVIENALCKEG